MSRSFISIILPYFNAKQTLARSIQSVLQQTLIDFELILINNNSTDNSLEIASHFATQDSRIQLLSENQQGVVFAANTGIKAASGKYIARMDADDVAHPERLERQLHHLESNPEISISATQVNYQTEHQELHDFSHFVDWNNELNSWGDIYQNRFVEFPLVNPTLMFRQSTFDSAGYLDEGDFPEDYEWFLRAIEKGHKIEKLPVRLLDWYDSSSRLTRTDRRYANEAFFAIKTNYLARHLLSLSQNKVWIWGAGKLGYKRSQLLLNHGVEIRGYIDIKKGKQLGNYPCVHFKDIELKSQPFIISYITNRDRRDEVRAFLDQKGYKEGLNYIIAG
ncbi:Glycosyltransferase, GT2 family [Reichenbachiella faecimaris]|uniref:Glycosyltransferase, GT2 family n=1 Tax=Reichenbachiella faecimaris TaxID=692418 RepID=A0A1W2GPN9_REIFA|nr:glycosyltransferase family 2 protein [Reichenbachiella faecimaris]SMD38623.1 Glycosyltransferase, GT2 family [Reichenbachiella faecimaris]